MTHAAGLAFLLCQQLLQQWQTKSRRFTRARLRRAQNVFTRQNRRNRFGLNGGGHFVALQLDGVENGGRQAQRVKCRYHSPIVTAQIRKNPYLDPKI